MRFRRNTPFVMSIVFVAILIASPGASTTIKPLDFSEVVRQAEIVVEGTVVDMRVLATGSDIWVERDKNHTTPMPQSENVKKTKAANLDRPQSVGVEGGRMLFTEITMAVDAEIFGDTDSSIIRFRVAGGSDEHGSVIVFGMPTFEIGKKYLVFLEPDFESTNVPVVGVNQGFFEITRSYEGDGEVLLNADGNIVVGVDNDRLLLKHNPDRWSGRTPNLAAAPIPATGSDVRVRTSPEVERFWSPTTAPMSRASFVSAVLAVKGGAQ